MDIRSLVSALAFRGRLANIAGYTYGRLRDMYKALGYQRELDVRDFRARFRRNEVANRVVKALPNATWRGGAEIWEDQDPDVDTPFELAFDQFDKRLMVWDTLRKADVLSRIGRYAVVLIGAPGEMDQPLVAASAEEIAYLNVFAEDDAVPQVFDVDTKSPRFGLPVYYLIKRTQISSPALNAATLDRRVHFSRVHHLANDLLEDRLYGEPALECIWNRLDDLEKVVGGGSEAFWRRADQGIQFDLDETQDASPEQKDEFKNQIQNYLHGFQKYLLTRGVTANQLGSDVADFKSPAESIISLICAGTGIPQRVLLGSEQGKLAARTDRGNWDDRVSDRRTAWAGPLVVKPFVNRLIELGALPQPSDDYEVRFPELKILDDEQRSAIATAWAGLNKPGLPIIVHPNEIRTRVLGLPTLSEAGYPDEEIPPAQSPQKNLQGKEGERWEPIHAAADRFPRAGARARRARFFRGT